MPSIVLSDSTSTYIIKIDFDEIENPPACFIPHKKLPVPKIGLAMSGGGFRGFAQIGVLQVLEENRIPFDFIVGTSMGSIIGGLLAAGYSGAQIEKITKSIDWSNIMVDKPPRTSLFVSQKQERGKAILQLRFRGTKIDLPQAITPGQKLTSILTNLTLGADFKSYSDFDQLKIPFRAMSCDLVTGNKVLLSQGNLAEAMKSSSAVPLLFEPVPKGKMLLVDGGLINNIPVDELKTFNVDIIIALDTTSKLNERNQLKIPWKVADQVTSIMQQEKNELQRSHADILIIPELGELKSDNFQIIDQLIKAGRIAAQKQIKRIKEIINGKNKTKYSDQKYQHQKFNISCPNDELCEKAALIINKSLGTEVSLNDVRLSLQLIYETGNFDSVFAECLLKDSVITVNYQLIPNPTFFDITFVNNSVFSDTILTTLVNSTPGRPINFYQSKTDILNILEHYQQQGFTLTNVETIFLKNDTLIFIINEGRISSIEIEGNNRTSDFVILREFPPKKGDIFNINQINNGINNIYSTNLFKTVSVDVKKVENQAKLKIKVEEKGYNLLRLGYHYDLVRKNKAMIEIIDDNFLGLANPLTFHTQFGSKDKVIKIKYRSDRIFKTFLTSNFEMYHQQINDFIFDNGTQTGEYLQKVSGFSLSFGRQIERLGVLSLNASIDNIQIQSISGGGYSTGIYNLKTIALQSIVDTQDKYPFPMFGKYYMFLYQLSTNNNCDNESTFFKLFSSLEIYHTFLTRNTIHPKIFWGTSDMLTPYFELFKLGGESSFYGLNEKEKLGRHIIYGSLEYRYKFPFRFPIDFYFSLRYDVGATWKNYLDISPKDFLFGMGSSLSIDSPIGPISFSVGRIQEGKNIFYFSAGFNF